MGKNNLKNNKLRGCGLGSLKGRDGKLSCFSECEESLEKAEGGRFYLPLSPLLLVLLLNVRQGKLG